MRTEEGECLGSSLDLSVNSTVLYYVSHHTLHTLWWSGGASEWWCWSCTWRGCGAGMCGGWRRSWVGERTAGYPTQHQLRCCCSVCTFILSTDFYTAEGSHEEAPVDNLAGQLSQLQLIAPSGRDPETTYQQKSVLTASGEEQTERHGSHSTSGKHCQPQLT